MRGYVCRGLNFSFAQGLLAFAWDVIFCHLCTNFAPLIIALSQDNFLKIL
jgi:hypothetical protein